MSEFIVIWLQTTALTVKLPEDCELNIIVNDEDF